MVGLTSPGTIDRRPAGSRLELSRLGPLQQDGLHVQERRDVHRALRRLRRQPGRDLQHVCAHAPATQLRPARGFDTGHRA